MSKRRKNSRFTKTDVNTICEMQRKIDAYECYILGLVGHTSLNTSTKDYMVPLRGTEMDERVNVAWRNITKMKEKLEEAIYGDTRKSLFNV